MINRLNLRSMSTQASTQSRSLSRDEEKGMLAARSLLSHLSRGCNDTAHHTCRALRDVLDELSGYGNRAQQVHRPAGEQQIRQQLLPMPP